MKKQWLILVLVAVSLSLLQVGASTSAPPAKALKEQTLNRAIQDLQNPDKYVRLEAGRTIARLADTPGIQRAINPLIMAESDPGNREGILNRAIYIGALGPICRKLGSPVADNAVDFLISNLLNNPSDFIRVSAAQALGITINERALAPLETARDTDPSIDVVLQAEDSLETLNRELQVVNGTAQRNLSFQFTPLSLSGSRITPEQLKEYINTHLILLGNQKLP